MSKKRYAILAVIILTICITIILIAYYSRRKNDNSYIQLTTASKMLSLLEADKETILAADNIFHGDKNMWYEKYVNYMVWQGYFKCDEKDCTRSVNASDMKRYISIKDIAFDDVYEVTGVNLIKMKDTDKLRRKDFLSIYSYLMGLFGDDKGAHSQELVICGTAANCEGISKWHVCTTEGEYTFEGLELDKYIDKKIKAFVRDNEIIWVEMKLSDDVTYENVWLERGKGKTILAYIGNVKREFYTGALQSDFSQTIGDIVVKDSIVKSVLLKKDTIKGKVLMIDKDRVEIEGYGILPLSESFHVYRTYSGVKQKSPKDIMVGYNTTSFVVADKKVVAGLVQKNISADNIRVLVMSTGFTSIFHNRVSVTSENDYYVQFGDTRLEHKAGEITDICVDGEMIKQNRVVIASTQENGKIKVLSVEKAQGNPSYRGKLEIAQYEQGLVLVNEVPIEEYLYAVVPSEMPNRFGVEALKVQAVCARSFAYKQLYNTSYAAYGAHVDDSVNFQVYNNVCEKEEAMAAVNETYGEVCTYNGQMVTTYYYSTSCGHTSDNSVWGGNPDSCPYLCAKNVNSAGRKTDLSNEGDFEEYINSTNEKDFDYGYGYYRWNVTLSLSDLTKSVNENIYSRYCSNPSQIKTLVNGKWLQREIRSVGAVLRLEIKERSSGGAITSLIVYGTENIVKIDNELNVRYVLCPNDNPITLLLGDTTTFYILPSAYCYFEEISDSDGLSGYKIIGGGYGHGIGMSQNAVFNMVKSGMKYNEIIEFFFEGTKLKSVYDLE